MEKVRGWLLDAYAVRDGMTAWVIADDGRRLAGLVRWRPAAFLRSSRHDAALVASWLESREAPTAVTRTTRRELMSGEEVRVYELRVGDARQYGRFMAGAMRRFAGIRFFNADIAPDRYWFYETGLYPLARISAVLDGGEWTEMACLDSVWDLDRKTPPLVVMGLRLEGPGLNPVHGGVPGALEVHAGGQVRVLDGTDPATMLGRLDALLAEHDPDVIVTEYGDAFLLPELDRLAGTLGVTLGFSRDREAVPRIQASKSYFTYGRIMHRDSCFYLNGRLHLDQRNSFTLSETGFEGLFETARLARLPLQVCARTSTGTAISSMQVALAITEGVLVPVDKDTTEDFKGADELLTADKGGLVFQPEPGLHSGVGELDFASMYPTIMVRHNLSPETMNCPCCRDDGERVPENPSWVCRRRRGLIPRVLAPLLERRARCRELKKTAPTEEGRKRAAAQATAHKWMMVCSFGYLGYRNARFGRIEAHEATTAFGREALLRAKEVAEDSGYEVLHAIVDCIWVRRPGARESDFLELAEAIEAATDIRVSIEGVYRWLAFLPSTADSRRGVAQRYMGVFADGETKARGIEGRRSDCPPFVRDMQSELLAELAKAVGPAEAMAVAAGLSGRVAEAVAQVRSGRLRAPDLVIWGRLSKKPEEYSRATPLAVASGQLVARGGTLEAGERVGYVFGDERPWAVQILPDGCPYDTEKYAELTLVAARSVLGPFGVTEDSLRAACGMGKGPPEDCQLEFALDR